MRQKFFNLTFFLSIISTFFLEGSYVYPFTPRDSITEHLHGIDVEDAYRWLENSEDQQVINWTKDQNDLAYCHLKSLTSQKGVKRRVKELVLSESVTFTETKGGRRFSCRRQWGAERPIYYWQQGEEGDRIDLIDFNTFPTGYSLDFAIPSCDGTYVALGVSCGGDEQSIIKIVHVETKEILQDTLVGRKQGWPEGLISWLPDNSGFFYSTYPQGGADAEYWNAIYFHHLGTAAEQDECSFHCSVRESHHYAIVSPKGEYAIFVRQLGNRTELYLKNLLNSEITALCEGMDAKYSASFIGDSIAIVTNCHAPNYKAYLVDPKRPQRYHWKIFIPQSSEDTLLKVEGIAGLYYATFLSNAHTIVKVYSGEGEWLGTVPLHGIGTASVSGLWDEGEVWVDFVSFTHPLTRYCYDVENNRLKPVGSSTQVVDPSLFTVKQVWYCSKDGTTISMFLIHLKGHCEKRPTLLTGYGGFGISFTPRFLDTYIPFLEAGGVIAIANLRGGGEYGEQWHEAGMLDKKQNVFDDFISAAEWLIDSHYTTPSQLAIRGRSNGGLLVGAAMTQRPDLFRAVLCEVPLLDMVRYHKFGYSGIWAEEYGNAENFEQFHYLLRYSPYHSVVDGVNYPAVLLRASENDTRTDALHARKMIARLQAADPIGRPKLLIVDKDSGHYGATTTSEQIRQHTEGMVFLMNQLGMLH